MTPERLQAIRAWHEEEIRADAVYPGSMTDGTAKVAELLDYIDLLHEQLRKDTK